MTVPPYCGAPVAVGVIVGVDVEVTVVEVDVEVVVEVDVEVEVKVDVEVEVTLLQDASSMAATNNRLNPNQITLFFTFVLLFI